MNCRVNVRLHLAITLACAWCDKMFFFFTLYYAVPDREGYVFTQEDADAWPQPEEFQRVLTEMPATRKAAWGRIDALLALRPSHPVR